MFSPQLLDHFEHPRNAGEVEHPDAAVEVGNPACGDILRLSVKASGGRISELRFRAKGCVASMACASALTELARGCSVEQAKALSHDDIVRAVGGVPEASTHAAQLALDALAALLRKLGS
jgi:nitrogen fixation protein NifU and related proteins